MLAGSFWELVRFFLLIMLIAVVLDGTGVSGPWIYPWLLLIGSPSLVVAAGALLLSLFPLRYGALIGMLRLGKLLGAFTFLLVVLSRALRAAQSIQFLVVGRMRVNGDRVAYSIFLVDALFLAFLVAWRRTDAA